MKGLREIKSRIKAVKSTGQITHAMQLVAASKMKRAQQAAERGRPYSMLLLDLLDTIEIAGGTDITHPLFDENRPPNKRLIIVFSTDKGLAGPLNTNLFKTILDMPKDISFIVVGEKCAKFLARMQRNVVASFRISDNVKFSEIKPVAQLALERYLSGESDTIEVLYSEYVNTLKQVPTCIKLAPATELKSCVEHMRQTFKLDAHKPSEDAREFSFEPSIAEILEELPSFYIKNAIYHMALDAKASEQSSRMVAMKSASDNADRLLAELSLEFNKARQNAITTEIIELASGAAAQEQGEG